MTRKLSVKIDSTGSPADNGPMSQDDPTTKLPDEAKYDTKPGITAVLERINQLGEELKAQIAETQAGIRRIEHKIDLLVKDNFEIRTDHSQLAARIDELERKAS